MHNAPRKSILTLKTDQSSSKSEILGISDPAHAEDLQQKSINCKSRIQAAEGSGSRALGNETEREAKAISEDTAWVVIHLPKHLAPVSAAAPKMAITALVWRPLSYTQHCKENPAAERV